MKPSTRDKILNIVMPVVRTLLGITFILSGFVKAVDPRGFAYKIGDYLQSAHIPFPSWIDLPVILAVGVCMVEFILGIYLLLGLRRRLTAVFTLAVMTFFTVISLLLVIFHPVANCGCFGDFLVLDDWQTFGKNIVLLALSILLIRNPRVAKPWVPVGWQWFISLYTGVFIFIFCLRSLYYLPLIDFRPYKIGANLKEMVFPTQESRTDAPPLDLMVTDTLNNDFTAQILMEKRPVFLVITPKLDDVSSYATEQLADTYDWCADKGYLFYCITASTLDDIRNWCYYNDAQYPFLLADYTTLTTMIRSNPGLMLVRNGVVRNKWSAHHLPDVTGQKTTERQLEAKAAVSWSILGRILAWYLLPMLVLILLSNSVEALRRKLYRPVKVKKNDKIENNLLSNNKNIIKMRKKIVAGNWKMNMTLPEGVTLVNELKEALSADKPNCGVVICTPFIHLATVAPIIEGTPIELGAENCADKANGAYTGEVSAAMVKSTGATYVILGHSERRAYYHETPEILKEKVKLALENGLKVIFCIGEVLEEREAGKQNEVVAAQLQGSLYDLTPAEFSNIVLAYEPVWAIGTGKTATADQAEEMHAFIRQEISKQFGADAAENTTILYGGSCKPSNAKELFAKPDVDGGLIGGASLKAVDFKGIIDAWKA